MEFEWFEPKTGLQLAVQGSSIKYVLRVNFNASIRCNGRPGSCYRGHGSMLTRPASVMPTAPSLRRGICTPSGVCGPPPTAMNSDLLQRITTDTCHFHPAAHSRSQDYHQNTRFPYISRHYANLLSSPFSTAFTFRAKLLGFTLFSTRYYISYQRYLNIAVH